MTFEVHLPEPRETTIQARAGLAMEGKQKNACHVFSTKLDTVTRSINFPSYHFNSDSPCRGSVIYPPAGDVWQYLKTFFIVGREQEGFPDSSVGKESACNAGDPGSIPG